MSVLKKSVCQKNNSGKQNKAASSSSYPAPSPMSMAVPFLGELRPRPIHVTRRIRRISTHRFSSVENNCGIGSICGINKLESELCAIYNSLYLTYDNDWDNIQLETSSNEAIQIFEFRMDGPPAMRNVIHTGHILLQQLHVTLDYIHISQNTIATKLARMGAEQSSLCKIIYQTPENIEDCITDNKLEACSQHISESDTD